MKRSSEFVPSSLPNCLRKLLEDSAIEFMRTLTIGKVGLSEAIIGLTCFGSLTPRAKAKSAAIVAEGTE